MKLNFLFILLCVMNPLLLKAQSSKSNEKSSESIRELINQYSLARDRKDTVLLKSILTPDIDQLVSSGEWRNGIKVAVQGMLRSSENNSGSRKIIVDKIKFLTAESAIADARYEIQNADGSVRKMWSSFIVVFLGDRWKISAIRNMLPAQP